VGDSQQAPSKLELLPLFNPKAGQGLDCIGRWRAEGLFN